MGSVSCKTPKSSEQDKKKEDGKKIIIGVFGLDNAGKTSTVEAIKGAPTRDTEPTVSSETTKVPYPTTAKGDSKSQERVTIIDVSGAKKYRGGIWVEYYPQIHGLIYVIDTSEKSRITENKNVLKDLLDNNNIRDKPILILVNKQDQRGGIKEEDHFMDKFQLDDLKAKHKIVKFCTAIPNKANNNKTDDSIRQGFSWLIRTIETNYTELNSRVNNTKNPRQPRPVDRKPQINNKQKNQKSDDSDNDDGGVVYSKNRTVSPPLNKKNTDYRSTNTSNKLPTLNLNKTKTSGHETYDESDEDDDGNRSRSRPNIPRRGSDSNDRIHSLNQPNTSSINGFNKKKKVIGTTGNSNDLSTKKPTNNEPKPFRSPYEPFPEEALWSSSSLKTSKKDDITSKSFPKLPTTNDSTKRSVTPLIHDTKPFNTGSLSKRNNVSDDEDDDFFKRKDKLNSTLTSTSKPLSTVKKPTSGIYGANDDDDYLKNSSTYRRPNLSTPVPTITTTIKKPYKHDDDFDDEIKNKNSIDKNFQRPADRFTLNSEYRGTTSKPPLSPAMATSRFKQDDDDLPSSLLSKSLNRAKSNKDDYPTALSKPVPRSRFGVDDDVRPSSASKPPPYSLYGDNNRSSSPLRLTSRSKPEDDDFPSSKSTARKKYDDDDDDSPLVPKSTAYSKYNTNDRSSAPLKPISSSKFEDDDDYGSSSKTATRKKYGDDDDDDDRPSFSSKTPTRPKYNTNDRSSPSSKPVSSSRYEDDDDYGSSSKPTTYSKYNTNDRSSAPSKPTSSSKFEDDDDYGSSSKPTTRKKYDDDDDDDRPSFSSKTPTRPKYNANDRSSPSLKPVSNSRYEDDDDYGSSSKPTTYSKYNTNDRSSTPSKPTSSSKYEDDDDYGSSSKPTTRSKYNTNDRSSPPFKTASSSKYEDDDDDDYGSSKPVARKKYGDDDDYGGYGGTNSSRAGSASASRFRPNSKSDT